MAKRKDKDAAKKGFQIPIQDGDEMNEEPVEPVEEAEADDVAEGAGDYVKGGT